MLRKPQYRASEPDDELVGSPPLAEAVVLRRDRTGVQSNVPHLVVHHSPTGYEWGYGGSGPADLALNILEAVLRMRGYRGRKTQCWRGTCYTLAWYLHQDFKWYYIAPMDRAGGTISMREIDTWLSEHCSTRLLQDCR